MSLESVGKFTKSRIVESGKKDLCLNNNQINQFIVKSWQQLTTMEQWNNYCFINNYVHDD